MTRARLQAEATGKHEPDVLHKGTAERHLSPLDFDSAPHEVRERTLSRDSTVLSQTLHVNGSNSTNSIPSLVQINEIMGRQQQNSPLSSGLQNYNQINPSTYSTEPVANFALPQQTWDSRQQQLKLDAIETASTNSYNTSVISDNLGSESAFSSGIGSGMSLPYTGQLIASDGKIVDGRSAPPSACASPASNNSFFFGAAVGSGTRRRAATLSPKPISILEDRPHFDGQDGQNLAMPNFNSAGRVSIISRARTNSASSGLTPNPSDSSLLGQSSGLFGLDESQNRPRTLSATSLPPLSHTADEFCVDRVRGNQFVSQGREGPATISAARSAFGDTSLKNQQFRFPPGFLGNTGYNSVGPLPSNNRNVYKSVAALSGEMGSILNLSGGSQNRERLNTYPQTSKSKAPEYISEEFFSKDASSFDL
jgi:hypothetical protein